MKVTVGDYYELIKKYERGEYARLDLHRNHWKTYSRENLGLGDIIRIEYMTAHSPHSKQFKPNNWQIRIDYEWKTGAFGGHTERGEYNESFYEHFRKIGEKNARGRILLKTI